MLPDDERAAMPATSARSTAWPKIWLTSDQEIAREAVDDVQVRRASDHHRRQRHRREPYHRPVGDIRRFREPQKLVSYFGINPRVRQSGLGLAPYGRISKHGRSHARAMLVEAAWAAAKALQV
ncbi:IS110 family transposase [Mesorhizobium sp. WSM3879]|uniref:IS110 family transposase n=1 Tax=Mesorhizobium sp. WSM3879 TaxID=2029406 RepID=UPI001FE10F8D|nr:IS110 family transposase [Mesorhizobium sp. WSM3879]